MKLNIQKRIKKNEGIAYTYRIQCIPRINGLTIQSERYPRCLGAEKFRVVLARLWQIDVDAATKPTAAERARLNGKHHTATGNAQRSTQCHRSKINRTDRCFGAMEELLVIGISKSNAFE